jgi:predicted HTH domain antitoxin
MSLIRAQSSRNREQEGRIVLAIQAFKKQEIISLREIARVFNVATLRDRLSGHT